MNEEETLTISVETLGKRLGVCKKLSYELVHSEGFPKILIGKRILIPTGALREWLNKNSVNYN